MGKASRIDRVRDIALEVATYRLDYDEQRERILESLDHRMAGGDSEEVTERRRVMGNLVFTALEHSHAAIRLADRHINPKGKTAVLTRRTLAATAFAGTPFQAELDTALDDCCTGAELKYIRGLEHHHLGRSSQPWHAAALILHDTAGEPLAYQKAIGLPLAYVWRDGMVQTHAGPRWLFAGSIVKPIYDRDSKGQSPPHEKFAGAGLVGLTGCVADDIEFKRFSLEVLPQAIRTATLLDASAPGAYDNYRCYVTDANAMNSTIFAYKMADLAKTAKTYTM
jgi:hypothetical protein